MVFRGYLLAFRLPQDRLYTQYDGAIATAQTDARHWGLGRLFMVTVIIFLISTMTFRNFSLYYWRSISAKTSAFVAGAPLP
jgi:hypothetical protein